MSVTNEKITVITKRSPTYSELYSNAVNVRVSVTDMTLVFGRGTLNEEGGALQQEELAVLVSPQTFKQLTLTVLSVLKSYEDTFGEIKLPAQPQLEGVSSIITRLANLVANAQPQK
jgi:hypothetical protein